MGGIIGSFVSFYVMNDIGLIQYELDVFQLILLTFIVGICGQLGDFVQELEKYFNENVENWENRTNYALIKQDEIRPGGEPGKRSNLVPFQEWWETERTRQGDEDGGVNPVTRKVKTESPNRG